MLKTGTTRKITFSFMMLILAGSSVTPAICAAPDYSPVVITQKPLTMSYLTDEIDKRTRLKQGLGVYGIKKEYDYTGDFKRIIGLPGKSSKNTDSLSRKNSKVEVDYQGSTKTVLPANSKTPDMVSALSSLPFKNVLQPPNDNVKVEVDNQGSTKTVLPANSQTPDMVAPAAPIPDIINLPDLKIDYKKVATSIVTCKINNSSYVDMEVIPWPNGTVSLPVKAIASRFKISFNQNHLSNNITFQLPTTGQNVTIDVKNSRIFIGSNTIDVISPKIIYIEHGFVNDGEDEIYVPQAILEQLFDMKSEFSFKQNVLALDVSGIFKARVEEVLDDSENSTPVYEEPMDVVEEGSDIDNPHKKMKFKKLTYHLGSSSYMNSSSYQNTTRMNANAGFTLEGEAFGGKYRIGGGSFFGEQGLQLNNYKANLLFERKKYNLSLGMLDSEIATDMFNSSNLLGVAISSPDYGDSGSAPPAVLRGEAPDNATIELYVNNLLTASQQASAGIYEFNSINYPNSPFTDVKVIATDAAGTKKILYNKYFSEDKDLLAPGRKRFLVYSGLQTSMLTGQLALWGEKYNNYNEPIRFVSGAKYLYGLTNNLTMGLNVSRDMILKNSRYNRDFFSASTLNLSRSAFGSSGNTVAMDLIYSFSPNLKFNSEFGASLASSKNAQAGDPSGLDFGGSVGFNYKRKNYSFSGKVYSFGPDYYTPGNFGFSDRRGCDIAATWNYGPLSFSGYARKYFSNLDGYIDGGRINFADYGYSLTTNINKKTSVSVNTRFQRALNSIYSESEKTLDLSLNRTITENANLRVSYIKIKRQRKNPDYNVFEDTGNTNINIDLNYKTKRFGTFNISHTMERVDPFTSLMYLSAQDYYSSKPIYSKNIRVMLDRSDHPFKGFILSPNLGYRYSGEGKGVNFGLDLNYKLKSGNTIGLSYMYNSIFARYAPGSFSLGGSKMHSLSLNYNAAVNFGVPKELKNNNLLVKNIDPLSSTVKGSVFLDLNQNKIKDADEIGLADVDINFENLFKITTDKDGKFTATNIRPGDKRVSVDKNTLPVLYTMAGNDALIKVRSKKMYSINFPVLPTPGSITGRVNVDNNKTPAENKVVIVLYTKEGKEIKYTSTDSKGNYRMDSIPPGDYIVSVDKNHLDYLNLDVKDKEPKNINIPMILDDFYDIKNLDFNLIPKEVQVLNFQS